MKIKALLGAALLALALTACGNAAEPNVTSADIPDDNAVHLDTNDDGYSDGGVYLIPRTVELKDGRTVLCIVAIGGESGGTGSISCDWENAK